MTAKPRPAAAILSALLGALLAATPAAVARAGDADAASRGNPAPAGEAPNGDDAEARLSRIEQAMWDRDPKAAPTLREWAARDPNDRVRERSVGALALLRDAQAVPVFLGRLKDDPSAAVRRAAAEALGLLRPAVDARRIADPLQGDPDPFVRAECARALGRLGGPLAGQRLLYSVVQDRSPEVRAVAAQALSAFSPPGAADVLRAVAQRDDSVLVRIYAVKTLAAISPGPSASLFRALWDGSADPDLRLEAFRGGLIAEGGDAWEQVGLADADDRVRFLAFEAWLARSLELRSRQYAAPDTEFPKRLEGFLTDRIPGIRDLAKGQLEALGFRIRPSGFGYAVER